MKPFQSLERKLSTEIIESFEIVWDHLGLPGSWWTGKERIGIAKEVRGSNPRKLWEKVGELKNYAKDSDEVLSPYVKAVVRIVANETSSINQQIYDEIINSIGEDKYAELAAVVSQIIAIDHLCDALGIGREKFPNPQEVILAWNDPMA